MTPSDPRYVRERGDGWRSLGSENREEWGRGGLSKGGSSTESSRALHLAGQVRWTGPYEKDGGK